MNTVFVRDKLIASFERDNALAVGFLQPNSKQKKTLGEAGAGVTTEIIKALAALKTLIHKVYTLLFDYTKMFIGEMSQGHSVNLLLIWMYWEMEVLLFQVRWNRANIQLSQNQC